MKAILEKEAEEAEEEKEDADLTTHEHERALKGAYRSFMMSGKPKIDVNSYFDQAKPYIKALIENQLKEMWPSKVLTLWVLW